MNHRRVLLADDHIIVLQGLQALLDGEFDIAGSVTDSGARSSSLPGGSSLM